MVQCLNTPHGHSHSVEALTLSQDKSILFSGSWDRSIRRWNWRTGETLQTLTGHLSSITCLAASPDGDLLASGSLDATANLRDWRNGTVQHTLQYPGSEKPSPVTWVSFSPDGKRLYTSTHVGELSCGTSILDKNSAPFSTRPIISLALPSPPIVN